MCAAMRPEDSSLKHLLPSAQLWPVHFTGLPFAHESLTTPLSSLPAACVNMAGPSSSTLDELQKQLNELNRLVIDELRKGTNRDEDLVAELRQERTSLVAQIAQIKQVSGEVQLNDVGSGQQGHTWMMLLAQAQSCCPLVCCWTRHGAASPSRQM